MTNLEIRAAVKSSIARITGIDPQEISDHSSYNHDLRLDSLTILEIAVDAEYQFKIKIPDDELGTMVTVEDTVRMVEKYLAAGAS